MFQMLSNFFICVGKVGMNIFQIEQNKKNYDELLKRFEFEKMPKHKDIKPLIVIARGKE